MLAMKHDIADATIEQVAKAVAPVLERHPVLSAYLFGSTARGERRAGSDIDLYCKIDRSKPFGLFALGGLIHDLQEALGAKVDVVTSDSLSSTNPRLLREIERDKVLIYERAEK